MSVREFLVLLMICTLWGLHFTVMKSVIGAGIPPLAYAAIRMALVMVVMLPWLKWPPTREGRGQMKWVLVAGLGFGALNYAFMFPAMGMTTASAGAIAIELYVPFSVILGALFLRDYPGWRKLSGIALAFAGVVLIGLARPGEGEATAFVLGLAMIAGAAMSEAVGALGVKKIEGMSPKHLLAWFAVVGTVVLTPLTLVFEPGGVAAAFAQPGLLALALLYTAGLVSIVAHGSYYWLLQRLPISTVAPSGLLTTVIGVAGAVLILGEPFTRELALGMAMVLTGVGIVLWRQAKKGEVSAREVDAAPET